MREPELVFQSGRTGLPNGERQLEHKEGKNGGVHVSYGARMVSVHNMRCYISPGHVVMHESMHTQQLLV